MDLGILIPISLFVCIAYAIKVCVDAMVRRRMVDAAGSPGLIDLVLRDERLRRYHSALRWGIALTFLSLGFGLVNGLAGTGRKVRQALSQYSLAQPAWAI